MVLDHPDSCNVNSLMGGKMLISLILLLLLLLPVDVSSTPSESTVPPDPETQEVEDTIFKSTTLPTNNTETGPQHRYKLTKPLQSDHLTPTCTFSVSLRTSARYSPPSACSTTKWSHVALHVQVTSVLVSRPSQSNDQPPCGSEGPS